MVFTVLPTSGPTLTVPYGRAPTLPYSLTTGGVYCPTSGPTLTVPYGRAPTLPYSLTTGGVNYLDTQHFVLPYRWCLLSYLWPYADCTLRTRSYSTLQSDYRWCYCPTSGPTLTVPYGRAPTLPYSLTTGGVYCPTSGPTLTVPYGCAPTLPYSLTTGGVYCPTSGPMLTVPYGRAPTLPYSLTTGGVNYLETNLETRSDLDATQCECCITGLDHHGLLQVIVKELR